MSPRGRGKREVNFLILGRKCQKAPAVARKGGNATQMQERSTSGKPWESNCIDEKNSRHRLKKHYDPFLRVKIEPALVQHATERKIRGGYRNRGGLPGKKNPRTRTPDALSHQRRQ